MTTAPINAGIQRILDVGAGPGDWAVAIAAKYPSAEVVAVDLAVWDVEATEDAATRNGNDLNGEVTWVIDDLDLWGPNDYTSETQDSGLTYNETDIPSETEDVSFSGSARALAGMSKGKQKIETKDSSEFQRTGWDFSESFDFIHIRGMKGAFADWKGVYSEAFKSLSPGGWIEVIDYDHHFDQPGVCDTLLKTVHATAEKSGYPINVDHLGAEMLEACGFEDVMELRVEIPLGTWPSNERQKALGKKWLVCAVDSVEAICMRLLTKQLGWDADHVREECRLAQEELLGGLHDKLRTPFIFITARKPKH